MKLGDYITAESRFLKQWHAKQGTENTGVWTGRVTWLKGDRFRLDTIAEQDYLDASELDITYYEQDPRTVSVRKAMESVGATYRECGSCWTFRHVGLGRECGRCEAR